MLGNDNTVNVFDKIPLFDESLSFISPTTGTQAQTQVACDEQLTKLQELAAKARSLYNTWEKELETYTGLNNFVEIVSPKIFQFNDSRLRLAASMGREVLLQIDKVCDAAQKDVIFPQISSMMFKEVGVATPKYIQYCADMLLIGQEASQIKIKSQAELQEVEITDSSATMLSQISSLPLEKIMYQLGLYAILPGGERIQLEPYIKELLYTRDFDNAALPIFSIYFLMPQTIMTHIKFHNDNIKWFVNINVVKKTSEKNTGEFRLPEVLMKDVQLIPVDPVYNMPQVNQETKTNTMPVYPLKIDLVSHKDTTLNANVKSRVFNNVRMLDVITTLCAELKEEYLKRGEATEREVKVTISPPDNAKMYEQILIEPGSFTKIINQLQEKYGIYNTGVRVSFDSVKTNIGEMSNSNITQITILGKGETAPGEDSIKDVIVDLIDARVVDKQYNVTEPFFDSGQFTDDTTGTVVLRSFFPYMVFRNNSDGLINGDSIRVMNSSSQDHLVSHCDSENTDVNMEKLYWSKYDNPFNLTQLQDSIRENKLKVQAEFKDINVLALSNNQAFRLKFYGEDDLIYSGNYRLSNLAFYYRMGDTVQGANDVEISAILTFYNVPMLKVNGTEIPRVSYGQKLEASRVVYSSTSQGEDANLTNFVGGQISSEPPPSDSASSANNAYSSNFDSGPPFKCIFAGRTDFYGKVFTSEIDADWQMSENVKFSNVYDTNSAPVSKNTLARTLAGNYIFFVNAQRFAKEVIEPCYSMFGTFGENNKVDSWLKLSSGLSQHNIALAVDSTWGSGRGQALAERFLQIAKSSIVYDQLTLESNNGAWTYIHIGKNLNSVNRGEIKVRYDGQQKRLNMSKVTSESDLAYNEILKVCY